MSVKSGQQPSKTAIKKSDNLSAWFQDMPESREFLELLELQAKVRNSLMSTYGNTDKKIID